MLRICEDIALFYYQTAIQLKCGYESPIVAAFFFGIFTLSSRWGEGGKEGLGKGQDRTVTRLFFLMQAFKHRPLAESEVITLRRDLL